MNSILHIIGDFLTWTFDTVLVPLGDLPNFAFIALGFAGMFLWLKMQGTYNKKAQDEGAIK